MSETIVDHAGRPTQTFCDQSPALNRHPEPAPKCECCATGASEFRLLVLWLIAAFAIGLTLGTVFGPWSFFAGLLVLRQ